MILLVNSAVSLHVKDALQRQKAPQFIKIAFSYFFGTALYVVACTTACIGCGSRLSGHIAGARLRHFAYITTSTFPIV